MEPIGTISEGEWTSLSGIYTSEEADFMAQLLMSCPLPNEIHSSWPSHNPAGHKMVATNEDSFYSLHHIVYADSYHFPRGSESSNGNILPISSDQDNYYIINDSHPICSMELRTGNVINTTSYSVQGDDIDNSIQVKNNRNFETTNWDEPNPQEEVVLDNGSHPKPKLVTPIQDLITEDNNNNNNNNDNNNSWKSQRRRSRSSADHAQINKRNERISKIQKVPSDSNIDEENNGGLNGPASSCYSEDDSSGSHELHCKATSSLSTIEKQALNLNGKNRASRGAATDPQSLYARKRRERINERLRILQNLVPNGTKVDISTMLEEAVQYVKFLQLQIKLLSSDDLWMYAPIAYNGMDVGLNLMVPTSTG